MGSRDEDVDVSWGPPVSPLQGSVEVQPGGGKAGCPGPRRCGDEESSTGHSAGPVNPQCRALPSKRPSSDHPPSLGHSAHSPHPRRWVGLPSLCHILSLGGGGGQGPWINIYNRSRGMGERSLPKEKAT